MANQQRNGRNIALPDENQPTWRPDDRQDRDWDSHWDDRNERGMERYGQGQSGYAAGRYEGDRSYGSRNQQMGSWDQSRERDDRGDYNRDDPWNDRQQSSRSGGRGAQGQGGMYGQGGYNEGMYGRGGEQDRYGSQGHQGWGQSTQRRSSMSDQRWGQQGGNRGMYGGSGGYGEQGQWESDQTFGQQRWQHGTSGMGYGQQREHDMPFRSGSGSTSHRGKGPQGYMRSDERIREMVCDYLTDDHHVDASNVEVTVKNGEVTLNGNVSDRQQKRRAEDIIENLSGVKDVINNLRVGSSMSSATNKTSGNGAGTSNDSSAVNMSGREQSQQGSGDKRHRA